ncbi:MAG: hypothetical protein M3R69_11760 [Acidobacteriota bacterium]|nr:hypothetical protein [Acidobacteriota bacterium]
MPDNRVTEMQRLRYWQGQKLLSRDFRDQTSFEAQLRWWHNRALHNSYGVSYGLEVTLKVTRVQVDCGVAYDCYGRELILQAPREIALAPAPTEDFGSITLLATFAAADRCISSKEILMGTVDCSSKRLQPWFQWKASRSLELVDGVPLAEIRYEPSAPLESLPANVLFPPVLAQKISYDEERKLLIAIGGLTASEAGAAKLLSSDPAFVSAVDKLVTGNERSAVLNARFTPRLARPFARPRIGSGATVRGDTAWELWSEATVDPTGVKYQADLGIQVTIDTSGAGFTEVPCYFAWLEGTLWNQVHLNFFPVPITHIDRESRRRFRLRLWMPQIVTVLGARIRFANVDPFAAQRKTGKRGFATDFVNFARQQGLYVCWMGIQEMAQPECRPLAPCGCDVTVREVGKAKTVETPPRHRARQIEPTIVNTLPRRRALPAERKRRQ